MDSHKKIFYWIAGTISRLLFGMIIFLALTNPEYKINTNTMIWLLTFYAVFGGEEIPE